MLRFRVRPITLVRSDSKSGRFTAPIAEPIAPETAYGVYTIAMKTARSIPEGIFERTERQVRRERRSGSEVHAAALGETTDMMNRACEAAGDEEDAFLAIAGRHALHRVEW